MTRKLLFVGLAGWAICMASPGGVSSAFAAPPEGGFYFGALAGPSFVDNDIGTRATFGLRAGSQFHDVMSAGVYVSTTGLGDTSLSQGGTAFTRSSRLWLFALEAGYELREFIDGLMVGAKAGVARTNITIDTADAASLTLLRGLGIDDTTATDFAVGPALGYRVAIQPNLSVGGEASFIFVTGDQSLNLFNVLGTVTLWF